MAAVVLASIKHTEDDYRVSLDGVGDRDTFLVAGDTEAGVQVGPIAPAMWECCQGFALVHDRRHKLAVRHARSSQVLVNDNELL